jgi:hypothetical protein
MRVKQIDVHTWTETCWTVLNVRSKTLAEYMRLYLEYLETNIGLCDTNFVEPVLIQQLLTTLSPQTAKHSLMVKKSVYSKTTLYK